MDETPCLFDRLAKQTAEILDRSRRLHFKSLGGILALQDTIAARWTEKNASAIAESLAAEFSEKGPDDLELCSEQSG